MASREEDTRKKQKAKKNNHAQKSQKGSGRRGRLCVSVPSPCVLPSVKFLPASRGARRERKGRSHKGTPTHKNGSGAGASLEPRRPIHDLALSCWAYYYFKLLYTDFPKYLPHGAGDRYYKSVRFSSFFLGIEGQKRVLRVFEILINISTIITEIEGFIIKKYKKGGIPS